MIIISLQRVPFFSFRGVYVMKGSTLLVCVHKPQFLLRWRVSGEGEGALLGVVGRLQKCLFHFLVAWLKYFCF